MFFSFLENELGLDISHMSAKDLQDITLTEFERYLEYLTLYYKDDTAIENAEKGIARKMSSLRSLYKYYYKKEVIDVNVTTKLETPKIHQKPILRLTGEETLQLLHIIETGDGLSDKQLKYHHKTKIRDLAIFTLFLTTGIRISELCALDVSDFDFKSKSFRVLRKGGNEVLLYFGSETEQALTHYLEDRKKKAMYSLDSPMFLSMQNNRMSVRALQQLVKKVRFFGRTA